jgi:hypothetical protein
MIILFTIASSTLFKNSVCDRYDFPGKSSPASLPRWIAYPTGLVWQDKEIGWLRQDSENTTPSTLSPCPGAEAIPQTCVTDRKGRAVNFEPEII